MVLEAFERRRVADDFGRECGGGGKEIDVMGGAETSNFEVDFMTEIYSRLSSVVWTRNNSLK